jgi:hypothetical protein
MSLFNNKVPKISAVNNAISPVEQGDSLLFQTSTVTLGSSTQTVTVNNIRNPNGLPMSNLYLDFSITDETGTTAPSGVSAVDSAFTNLTIYGASGKQLLNVQPNSGSPLTKLQHRLNFNGYYNTAPTPTDTSASTSYTADFNVLLSNWIIYPEEFPLTASITINTLSSRASTLNGMTSTAQVSAYGAFTAQSVGMPRTQIRVKPVTGITATNYYFDQFLDTTNIYDIAIDAGTDTNIVSGAGGINVLVNNNSIIPNTSKQSVINAEDVTYSNISTPHIAGFFPLNVLRGMRTLNPSIEKDSVQVNFADAPTASGTSGQANLYMIEAY